MLELELEEDSELEELKLDSTFAVKLAPKVHLVVLSSVLHSLSLLSQMSEKKFKV